MREDMAKVIVERPRIGGSWSRPKRVRRVGPDAELLPRQEGMRRRHDRRKLFNDYLAPLRRFLRAQVGRPWDKVHAELAQALRLDSTVQRHVLGHVRDYVAVHTRIEAGRVWVLAGRGAERPIERTGALVYVHPVTGILRPVKERSRKRRRSASARSDVVRINDTRQYCCLGGVWYAITLAPLTGVEPTCRDVVLGRTLQELGVAARGLLAQAHGRSGVIGVARRQLGTRQLRAAGLSNQIR